MESSNVSMSLDYFVAFLEDILLVPNVLKAQGLKVASGENVGKPHETQRDLLAKSPNPFSRAASS